ncbi:MAG: universal stress protein [Solirubrobacterales bacterium]
MNGEDRRRPSAAIWVVAITYAAIGSSIYFALGVIAKDGLGLTPVILLVAGLLFFLTLFAFLEGATMLRERGGSSSLVRAAFGEFLAFVAGWVVLLDFVVVISLAVLSIPHYLEPYVGRVEGSVWEVVLLVLAVGYIVVMNLVDLTGRRRPRFLVALALGDLVIQGLVVVIGLLVFLEPGALTASLDLGSGSPGVEDALYAAVIALVAYAGLEAVSDLVPELDISPERVGKLVGRSAWTIPLLFAAIAVVALLALPVVEGPGGASTELGTTFLGAPLLGVVSSFEPGWLADVMRYAVGLVAALTLLWAANTGLLALSRHTFSLAVHRQIPIRVGVLGKRFETPYRALILAGVAVFLLALFGDVEVLAGLFAFGATLAITLAHLALIRLRITRPDAERPFSAPLSIPFRGGRIPLTSVAGALLGGLAFISVLVIHDEARWVGAAWLVAGLVGYAIYRLVVQGVGLNKPIELDTRTLTRPEPRASLGRILVPLFGTALDQDIVSTAGLMAAEEEPEMGIEGATVILLYTTEVPMSQALDDSVAGEEERLGILGERARAIAEEYEGVSVDIEAIHCREAGEAIVEAAGRLRVDAVVMGAEPPTGIKGGPQFGGLGEARYEEVGPVTLYVLSHATVPVLVTAPPADQD